MKRLGIKGTVDAIRSANGPAQHISCAVSGMILSGMFLGMVEPIIVASWAAMSVVVLVATVWLPKVYLKYSLLTDFVLSMVVMFQYLMYEEPKPMHPVYYSTTASGMTQVVRPTAEMSMSTIEAASHIAALVWLSLWSLYLANLVHRQLLERKRFDLNDR